MEQGRVRRARSSSSPRRTGRCSAPCCSTSTGSSRQAPNSVVTIVIPEFVPRRWWQHLLHNQTALLVKGALLFRRGVVVVDVPFHLEA